MTLWCRLVVAGALCATLIAPAAAQSKDKRKDPDQIGDRDVGTGVNFYSLEKEIALGKQLAQEVERQAKFVTSAVATEYVNRLAQNLARNSDLKVPVTAKLIDSGEVNAFALPGGFLFINSGLILATETEAELAAVMAHEVAHVAARHGTRQASRGHVANIASLPLIFMGGWPGYLIRQGTGLALPLTFLKFSRAFEEEADFLGLQYAYKTGYDPTAFVDFLERIEMMEKKRPGTMSELFRSHPKTTDRIRYAQKNLDESLAARPMYVISTSEFHDVRSQLASKISGRRSAPEKTGPTLRRPSDGEGAKTDEDERPTLKRRDQ
jgi:beta-barrel assembly-enhancing protease